MAKQKLEKFDWLDLLVPLVAVIVSIVVGLALVALVGKSPLEAGQALWVSSFGSKRNLGQFLMQSTPLVLTGLSVGLAFRTGLFNIGAEGQYLAGGIVAAILGYALDLPRFIHLPVAVLGGFLAGGLLGAIPGFLKARLGVHEVINTIMLNWIMLRFTQWLVDDRLRIEKLPRTPDVLPTAKLASILPPSQLSSGLFLAVVVAAIVYFLLFRTRLGYEMRAVGYNPLAAEYGGINVASRTVLAMSLAGGLAGLAGVVQALGVNYTFNSPPGLPGYGFTGLTVALLGRNHPIAIILAALLFGFLEQGAPGMQALAGVPKTLVYVVQAVVIFLIAADGIIRSLLRRRKKEVKA